MTTTIQSIGRVACSIPEVTEVCLHGLTTLLSNKDGEGCLFCMITVLMIRAEKYLDIHFLMQTPKYFH